MSSLSSLLAGVLVLLIGTLVGSDYESAVTSAAFIGFNMGSTATAMASMQAITDKYGPAPQSYLIVPLAGAFFIDIMNAFVLTLLLALPFMGASLRGAVTLVLHLALAGCGGGPDVGTLRKDVVARLAEALPGGEVALTAFNRRGSQSDSKASAGETRRVVYFDAELKLERDFDFGAWDGPGVAGLVSALGAGPKGISGITAGGNKKDDRLRVHGTTLYRRDGDTWVAVVSGAFRPSVARLELLKQMVPKASRVAVLYNPTDRSNVLVLKQLQESGPTLGLILQPLEVREPREFEGAPSSRCRESAPMRCSAPREL